MILYITECGCEVQKDGLKQVQHMGEGGGLVIRLGCKKHKGIVLHRKTYCVVCGVEIISGLRGLCAIKCPEHTITGHRENMRNIKRIEGNPWHDGPTYPIDKHPRIDKYIPEASLHAHQKCYDRGIIGQKHDVEKTTEWSDFFVCMMNEILHKRGLRVL